MLRSDEPGVLHLMLIANVLRVAEVAEGDEAALQGASRSGFSQTCRGAQRVGLATFSAPSGSACHRRPDPCPFPVEVPHTLVLGESRLFLRGPEPRRGAGLDTSCLSRKETAQSLPSSRSVN